MEWIVIIAVWIFCGVVAYGRTFAHFQRQFPNVGSVDEDRTFAMMFAATGPFGMVISLLMGKHGMMFRPSLPPHEGEK